MRKTLLTAALLTATPALAEPLTSEADQSLSQIERFVMAGSDTATRTLVLQEVRNLRSVLSTSTSRMPTFYDWSTVRALTSSEQGGRTVRALYGVGDYGHYLVIEHLVGITNTASAVPLSWEPSDRLSDLHWEQRDLHFQIHRQQTTWACKVPEATHGGRGTECVDASRPAPHPLPVEPQWDRQHCIDFAFPSLQVSLPASTARDKAVSLCQESTSLEMAALLFKAHVVTLPSARAMETALVQARTPYLPQRHDLLAYSIEKYAVTLPASRAATRALEQTTGLDDRILGCVKSAFAAHSVSLPSATAMDKSLAECRQ